MLCDTTGNYAYNPNIPDDYSDVMDFEKRDKWGLYNVHDPCGIKHGDYYYVYCTDVMLGYRKQPRVGIPIRRSKDLVNFEFVGWVFDGIPSEAFEYVKKNNNGKEPDNIWAPFILKYKDVFRIYYSVSYMGSDASYIGLAESKSPEGPWVQKGMVVTTQRHTGKNAIDPTVITDAANGEQWMAYGSCFGGIFMMQLNPQTGLALKAGDQGVLVASRDGVSPDGCGIGENGINGVCNIEGADIVYNPVFKKYYMFLSYDWLGHKYNVRVGRADKPSGPYLDFFGHDFKEQINHLPVLTHAYKFENHPGWGGLGHCGILTDGAKFFMLHQGRLQPHNAMMDLHIRAIAWTDSGWPVVSPQRYVPVPQTTITKENIVGFWEEVNLNPLERINNSVRVQFLADGTIKDIPGSKWFLENNELVLQKGSDQPLIKVALLNAWDWENSRLTIVYSGLKPDGYSIWGKQICEK